MVMMKYRAKLKEITELLVRKYGKSAVIANFTLLIIGIIGLILILILWPKNQAPVVIESRVVEYDITSKSAPRIVYKTKEERQDRVFNILIENGYSVAGACGIMGNIEVECSEFEPDTLGNNGATYGLFQWNDVGDRRERMKKWCSDNGYDYRELDAQVYYAIYELEGGDSIATRMNSYLKKTDDAYTAAVEFAAGFERCITTDSTQKKYTGGIYPEFYGKRYQSLKKRITKAMNYYLHYGEKD